MDNNKKEINIKFNKKVVSISFLALALFMLLAVSYAYFTATVTGNDTAKKTTVTTGKMSLVFDGKDIIETKDNMVPGESVELKFSVLNNGNVATTYNIDMIEVENGFNPQSDLVYTVTSNNNGGSKSETIAPSQSETLIHNILIQPGEKNKQEYVLKLEFKETHSNQNSNQGKTFKGKVQINKLTDDSIATTILRANPIHDSEGIDFKLGSPKCIDSYYWEDYDAYTCNAYGSGGDGIFTAPDNDGISYYFRGIVDNNNVVFAAKKWKIIRINGDGSIRLILNEESSFEKTKFNDYRNGISYQKDKVGFTYGNTLEKECTKEHPCEVTYDKAQNKFFNDKFGGTNSTIKNKLEDWYQKNLNSYDDQIEYGLFCNDVSNGHGPDYSGGDEYYGAYERIDRYGLNYGHPTLICPDPNNSDGTPRTFGGLYKTKIGLITADEIYMAGINSSSPYTDVTNYLSYKNGANALWNLSPATSNDGASRVYRSSDYLYYDNANNNVLVAPVINLKPEVTFAGTGTADDPYVVSS